MPYEQRFAIGVDPGKPKEGHALAIVEQRRPKGSSSWRPDQAQFLVRDLQRFPAGTLYRDLESELSSKFSALKFNSRDPVLVEIALDQTAVGSSVADMILSGVKRTFPKCVVLTNDYIERETDGLYSIPKQVLIGNLEVLLETGRLKIAESLTETSTLAKELIGYRERRTTPLASMCWREEPADDLVFAVGLACWKLHQPPSIFEYEWLF